MIRKTARNFAAVICLLIGIAGIFLPIIPGIATIALAVIFADFAAKERLLERYRHTRVGRHLWERHEKRKASDAARRGCLPNPVPAPSPEPDPEPDSETLPQAVRGSSPIDK